MMSEAEPLSPLIGNIYDAALDQALWSGVLHQICDFVRVSAGNLYSQDSASTKAKLHYAYGEDPRYVQLYFDKYIRMNPFYPAVTFFNVGEVHSLSEIIPYEEFYETRFYKEWVHPQGIVDALFANLEKSATGSAVLSLRRYERDGFVDDEARRRMALLVPHIRRAVAIGNMIDFHKAEASMLADALGGLAAGVFLVDASARIVFANAAGQAMLEERKIFNSAPGMLNAHDQQADQALRNIFAAVDSGDETSVSASVGVSVPDRHGERWLAHVLPLTSGARQRARVTYSAVAAVFVRKATLDAASPMETLAKLYKLTASELRVLQTVVEVGGVAAVAEALGVSKATVKTHLHKVFTKTDTKRQAELVQLVATHASPFEPSALSEQ